MSKPIFSPNIKIQAYEKYMSWQYTVTDIYSKY